MKETMKMEIVHVSSVDDARRLLSEGYEPVECSLGESVVSEELCMDHHGEYSGLSGVAVRAYHSHFGARARDPRFVVCGAADADATFCIASLAGLLSHPSQKGRQGTADLGVLASLINRVDIAPIGIDLSEETCGDVILAWNAMSSRNQDALSFYAGVDRWRSLTSQRKPDAMIAAASSEESRRRIDAMAIVRMDSSAGSRVTALESAVWGFDVWYQMSPVIVALTPSGGITIGIENGDVAEEMFGLGGLKNIFAKLGAGWGGREAIGGSPRGETMSWADAVSAKQILDIEINLFAGRSWLRKSCSTKSVDAA